MHAAEQPTIAIVPAFHDPHLATRHERLERVARCVGERLAPLRCIDGVKPHPNVAARAAHGDRVSIVNRDDAPHDLGRRGRDEQPCNEGGDEPLQRDARRGAAASR